MERLRALALDNGTDVQDWHPEDRRTAVIEWFEQDEPKGADWIGDCLSERIGCSHDARAEVIRALTLGDEDARRMALGELVERALLSYPLDTLTRICEDRIRDWRMQERVAAAEALADSRAEDRLQRGEAA
jgi:hypothetical protein